VRTRDIRPGGDYLITVQIMKVPKVPVACRQGPGGGGRGFPGCRVRRRVTVVEATAAGVVVEADDWQAHVDPPEGTSVGWAVLQGGYLTWRQVRRRWTVAARQVLAVAPPAPTRTRSDVAVANDLGKAA
jgi:hypothetical protein